MPQPRYRVGRTERGRMSKQEQVLRALDELERSLEAFRSAYTSWLSGDGDATALSQALAHAEARLDAVRSMLASAAADESIP